MDHFAARPPFASFLPGIAGEWGIPVWCYYCNRGQAVSSFGAQDKDHAVMEFSPAHVAYQNTRYKGFRTFLKTADESGEGRVTEAFADDAGRMEIRPNELALHWENEGYAVDVVYFVVPGWRLGALARQVRITNRSGRRGAVTVLDGMPAVVCAGVNQDALKNMTQLAKAWMQAEPSDRLPNAAYYRVRYSMADTAAVHRIEEGNFALGMTEDGTRLQPIVDPERVFGADTSLTVPLGFASGGSLLREKEETVSNLFPCAFFTRTAVLESGQSVTLNELFGRADRKETLENRALAETLDAAWFDGKRAEAGALAQRLTDAIGGRTADPVFDAYSRQSYLDNLLRGGEPIRFQAGEKKNIFYLYSRKHGDMEREYNYFVMSPEYFSQGNGNFRDVAQNRRCDVRFHPWVGDENVRLFFSLTQSDGYNPLVIDRMTFRLPAEAFDALPPSAREKALPLAGRDFTPGQLAAALEAGGLTGDALKACVRDLLAGALAEPNATFGEGYWCDHWTYSLDLIENLLSVWPEKKRELLFGTADYLWYETKAVVLPHALRTEKVKRDGGTVLRQTRFLDMERKAAGGGKWMREAYGKGGVARSTLMEKILLLCAVKYAARDRAGIGIEMEGGKPGWYDALNGLPGIFGSSVADACELKRLIAYAARALEENGGEIALYAEMADLLRAMDGAPGWKKRMQALEDYREKTVWGVEGRKTALDARETAALLRRMESDMAEKLDAAVQKNGGICPTYVTFQPEDADDETCEGTFLPLFLEGPVRWMKLDVPGKRQMAQAVRRSGLYDEKLGMYKVNESLEKLTFEAGRCKAFTPGWLENESIWLHMEYKYLLELLRSGLYTEFEQALQTALIPFLDPAGYGRSTLENVSFLASSANPNPALHGRGFVARLSGSTVEFLSMWQEMMFGPAPFALENGALALRLTPMIPSRLIPQDGIVEAVFLGSCRVRYHIPGRESLVPGAYSIEKYVLDGREYAAAALPASAAEQVRRGEGKLLEVYVKR